MSAGNFVRSRYESNSGEIYPIRIQPETLALQIGTTANAAPTGAITAEVSARANGSRRTLGMNARTVTVAFTAAPPEGYATNTTLTIPVLTPELWDSASKGTTGTYLSVAVEVVGKSPEYAN